MKTGAIPSRFKPKVFESTIRQGKTAHLWGIHGCKKGFLEIINEPLGQGYFGHGTYFSLLDSSGIMDQKEVYSYRTSSYLCKLHISNPMILHKDEIRGRRGWISVDTVKHTIVSKLMNVNIDKAERMCNNFSLKKSAIGLKDYEDFNREIYDKLVKSGYDSIVYISNTSYHDTEHGSQVNILDTSKIEIIKRMYPEERSQLYKWIN